jgi:hypothetical protein
MAGDAGDHTEREVGRNRAAQQPADLIGKRVGTESFGGPDQRPGPTNVDAGNKGCTGRGNPTMMVG